jgi:hypothetical protein
MQAGGVAQPQASAGAKALFLTRAAKAFGCAAAELTVCDDRVALVENSVTMME